MIAIAEPVIEAEEIEAVSAVLQSGAIAQGQKVEEFEAAFAEFIGTSFAVAVNSGTAALHVALLAHGIGKGDEVITTPFTFIATANSILLCGAKPVFVDIDPRTFNIDPDAIARKITPKTKSILPVHLYGQPCNMNQIRRIASAHGSTIIEDACQAHGAESEGRKAGSFGAGCFSFYPTKNMTTGEGGMIATDDENIAMKARMIRSHGQKERYYHELLGHNFRMTDISAAIGLCQIQKLERFNNRRIENAGFLNAGLQGIKGVLVPYLSRDVRHVFHQYTIRVTEEFGMSRDDLRNRLKDKGIGSEVYYPIPIHRQPLYREIGYDEQMPNAEKASREVLSLPVHPNLSRKDLETIVEAIRSVS